MSFFYRILYPLFYICFGGVGYYMIEILYRGHSHYSMFLCGGIIFFLISLMNHRFKSSLPFIMKMLLATFIIIITELIFGIIFNLKLQLNIWDYSDQILNWKGQVCLVFSIMWFFLTIPVLYLDSFLQKHLF